jgi:pyruvate kinase
MDLPHWQYEIIRLCHKHKKECVWATQVLESMANSPRPLRSELTDVHAAIVHGADYTMLSAESATGMYPVETVEFMAAMWKKYAK